MGSRKTLFALEYEVRKLLSDNDFISGDGESGKQWYDNLVSDLAHLTEQEIEKAREEMITEIYNFVEGESGRSGRKEILEFISKLTTK